MEGDEHEGERGTADAPTVEQPVGDDAVTAEQPAAGGPDEGEVAKLRAEVAGLRAELDQRPPAPARRWGWRPVVVGALVVLASVGVLASTVGVWVHRNIYDTGTWVNTVRDLPSDPVIAEALAARITDEVVRVTDAEDRVRDLLPEQARILAGPVTTALEGFVRDAVASVITSEQFAQVWVAVNRFAHDRLVTLLRDEGNLVRTSDGQVQLDLLPIIADVLDRVAGIAPGLLGRGTPPDIAPGTPHDQEVAALASYLGIDLPEDFGLITVVDSDQLATAQDLLGLLGRVLGLTLVLTVAAMAGAIALSHRRRRTVLQLGLGAVAAIAVLWAVGRAVSRQVLDGIADEQGREVAERVLAHVTDGLRSMSVTVLVVGALVALVCFVVGDSRPARWLQAQFKVAAGATATLAAETSQGRSVAAWAATNEVGLRVGGLLLAVVVLLLVDVSWAWLVVVLAVLGLWQLLVSGAVQLAGRERGGPPTGPTQPAEPAEPSAA